VESFFEICVIRERKVVFQSSLRECHPMHSVLIVKAIASLEQPQIFLVGGRRVDLGQGFSSEHWKIEILEYWNSGILEGWVISWERESEEQGHG